MKTSAYIALVIFFACGLGAAAILLLKSSGRDVVEPVTQAAQNMDIRWGEGMPTQFSASTAAVASEPPDNLRVAHN